jgi:Ca2+-binding RTX toxin-like protein
MTRPWYSLLIVAAVLAAVIGCSAAPAQAAPTGSFDAATGVLTISFPAGEYAHVGVSAGPDYIDVCNACGAITNGIKGDDVKNVVMTVPAGFYLEVTPGLAETSHGPIPITISSPSQKCIVELDAQGLPSADVTTGPDWISMATPKGPQRVSLQAGALRAILVYGTTRADSVDLSHLKAHWEPRGGLEAQLDNGNNVLHAPDAPRNYVTAGRGNDRLWVPFGNMNEIHAGTGDNIVHAGPGGDTIVTGDGSDQIFAGGGTNYVTDPGGKTSEIVTGSGPDLIIAKAAYDVIRSGGGNDAILASSPAVRRVNINAGAGNDSIYVRPSIRYQLNCGPGHDETSYDMPHAHGCEKTM